MVSFGNIRLALAILVTMTIIGVVAAVSLKGTKQVQTEPVLQQLPQNIDVALQKARFTEMRAGRSVWDLVADRAEYDKGGEAVRLYGIRMEFAKTGSEGAISVTASQGGYSSKSRDVKLWGKVRVTTESGAIFETDSINYLAARSQFRASGPVTFRHLRLVLNAHGMDLNVKDQKAHFHSAVDATVAGL